MTVLAPLPNCTAMSRALPNRRFASLFLTALVAVALAGCKTEPQPWSPEADKIYHEIYGPIIDGG
jgi:hypothetical protein